MDLTSEYENLLKYLETEKNKWEIVKKPITSPTINSEKIKEYKNLEQNVPKTIVSSTSTYFDVSKFERSARESLIKEFKRKYSRDKKTVSVSELLSCVRKNYYFRSQTPLDLNQHFRFAYLELINEVGNTVHSYIQKIYNFDEIEKPIECSEYNIRGRVDGIIKNSVIELKTIDQEKFNGKVLPQHYNQSLIYAYMLNKYYDYKINVMTIVYIIRNLKQIIPIDIILNWSTDAKKAELLMSRSNILLDSLKNNKLPDTIGSNEEECKYCPFKSICGTNKRDNKTPSKEDKDIVVLL